MKARKLKAATRHQLYLRLRALPCTVHLPDARFVAGMACGLPHWASVLAIQLEDRQLIDVAAAIEEPDARLVITAEQDRLVATVGAFDIGEWPLLPVTPLHVGEPGGIDVDGGLADA